MVDRLVSSERFHVMQLPGKDGDFWVTGQTGDSTDVLTHEWMETVRVGLKPVPTCLSPS